MRINLSLSSSRAVSQRCFLSALICLVMWPAWAQIDRIYRSVRALSGKEMQLTLFGRANTRECKPLPLPEIHVIAAPEHGSLRVRAATVTTNQYQGCPNLKLKVQVLLYKSAPDYVGSDTVSFAVTFENGERQAHQISIAVAKEGEPSKAEEL
jgi:hypothetical protein